MTREQTLLSRGAAFLSQRLAERVSRRSFLARVGRGAIAVAMGGSAALVSGCLPARRHGVADQEVVKAEMITHPGGWRLLPPLPVPTVSRVPARGFWSGHHVVVIGATDAESLQSAMRALAISFARRLPTEKGDLEAVNYLPKEGLRPETIKLILKDAFGYDKLDRVITADYSVEGTTVTLFVSKRASPAESAQLAQAYYQFLKDDMGADALTAKQASRLPSGVFGVSALGQFELVGSHGPILYGVHASPSFEAGCRVLEAFLKTTESTQP